MRLHQTFAQQVEKLNSRDEILLLVIDVQKKFCRDDGFHTCYGTPQTEALAERVEAVTQKFRAAGIPICGVYYSGVEALEVNEVFYKFQLRAGDRHIRKTWASVMKGSALHRNLKKEGKKLILVCGVYLDQCVQDSLLDMREKGYAVCLLRDLTCGWKNIECEDPLKKKATLLSLRELGVVMEHSARALDVLSSARAASPTLK